MDDAERLAAERRARLASVQRATPVVTMWLTVVGPEGVVTREVPYGEVYAIETLVPPNPDRCRVYLRSAAGHWTVAESAESLRRRLCWENMEGG